MHFTLGSPHTVIQIHNIRGWMNIFCKRLNYVNHPRAKPQRVFFANSAQPSSQEAPRISLSPSTDNLQNLWSRPLVLLWRNEGECHQVLQICSNLGYSLRAPPPGLGFTQPKDKPPEPLQQSYLRNFRPQNKSWFLAGMLALIFFKDRVSGEFWRAFGEIFGGFFLNVLESFWYMFTWFLRYF